MTKIDSLDNITLDSDELRSIERFENNYYNHKNNIIQNGGVFNPEQDMKKKLIEWVTKTICSAKMPSSFYKLKEEVKKPELKLKAIPVPVQAPRKQASKVPPKQGPVTQKVSSPSSTSSVSPPKKKKNMFINPLSGIKNPLSGIKNPFKSKTGGGYNINKLEKDIIKLHNNYVISQNQNGGKNNKLSLIIKKKIR